MEKSKVAKVNRVKAARLDMFFNFDMFWETIKRLSPVIMDVAAHIFRFLQSSTLSKKDNCVLTLIHFCLGAWEGKMQRKRHEEFLHFIFLSGTMPLSITSHFVPVISVLIDRYAAVSGLNRDEIESKALFNVYSFEILATHTFGFGKYKTLRPVQCITRDGLQSFTASRDLSYVLKTSQAPFPEMWNHRHIDTTRKIHVWPDPDEFLKSCYSMLDEFEVLEFDSLALYASEPILRKSTSPRRKVYVNTLSIAYDLPRDFHFVARNLHIRERQAWDPDWNDLISLKHLESLKSFAPIPPIRTMPNLKHLWTEHTQGMFDGVEDRKMGRLRLRIPGPNAMEFTISKHIESLILFFCSTCTDPFAIYKYIFFSGKFEYVGMLLVSTEHRAPFWSQFLKPLLAKLEFEYSSHPTLRAFHGIDISEYSSTATDEELASLRRHNAKGIPPRFFYSHSN